MSSEKGFGDMAKPTYHFMNRRGHVQNGCGLTTDIKESMYCTYIQVRRKTGLTSTMRVEIYR